MPRHNVLQFIRPLYSPRRTFDFRCSQKLGGLRAQQTRPIAQIPWQQRDQDPSGNNIPDITLNKTGEFLLRWSSPRSLENRLHGFYLRDHCGCTACRHPHTKQRLLDTFSVPEDIKAKSYDATSSGLRIIWDNDLHESVYTWDWLRARVFEGNKSPLQAFRSENLRLWDNSIKDAPPSVQYNDIMNSEAGVKSWTDLIRLYGFCFVDGCPPTPKATQELIERITFIRHTHYGGFWDFTSDLASKDTAYTSLALEAHTDNTYFSDPAGLQLFHLLSHTDGDGGESLFVDGFRAAIQLHSQSFKAYKALSTLPLFAHASGNEGIHITPTKTFSVLEEDGERRNPQKSLMRIRWNNADRAALSLAFGNSAMTWYNSARKLNNIIRDPASEYWVKLEPGRPIIFNNWRVLHGRAAFTGKRRMCGGYINMDDYVSRWKTLNVGYENILETI